MSNNVNTFLKFMLLRVTRQLLFTPRPVTHAQKPQNSGFAQVDLGFVTRFLCDQTLTHFVCSPV